MRHYAYILLGASVLLTACSIREDDFTPGDSHAKGKALTISATHSSETKTSTQDGGTTVFWEPAEQIKVFNAGAAGLFTSQNNALSESADFTGELPYTAGDLLTALYPYTEEAVLEGDTLRTSLPAYQAGRQGSFAKNTNIAAAQSTSLKMKFMNVCGGIRFTLSRNDITKVAFQGVGQEALAGDLAIVFEGGVPVVSRVYNEYTRVFTTPEEGETFVPGEWYYLEMAPATLSQGVIVTFYTADNKTGVAKSTNPLTISRSYFMSKENLDSEVEVWEEEETQEMATQQNSMDIEIPESYNQDYINSLRISNFYGDYDLAADKKGNKIVRRRTPTKSSSSFAYAPLFLNGTYKTSGKGYMYHYLLDKENKAVMCCVSKGDAPTYMNAKSTAITLLLNTPQLVTANPYEIEYIIRELEQLDEFKAFVAKVFSKIEDSMTTCKAPDYSTLDRMPVIRALIGRYMESADAKDGLDLIDEVKDVANHRITLKFRNHYRRVIHIYGKRLWMGETNMPPIREENVGFSLADVLRKIQGTGIGGMIGADKVDADDFELAEQILKDFSDNRISLDIPFPYILEPQSANYWRIVKGSAMFWNPDRSSPFESTTGDLEFDMMNAEDESIADKLQVDIYGIGKFDKISQFDDEQKARMLLVLIHGVINDFIMPIYGLVTGYEAMSEASGVDAYKYDLRYGARKAPVKALGKKLWENCPPETLQKIFSKARKGDIVDTFLEAGDYVFKEIWGNNNNEDKRTYHNLLYNCFKKWTGISATSQVFRDNLKGIWNEASHAVNANFIGATINTSEALLDLAGAFAAASHSDFLTTFVRNLDNNSYITVLSPTKGTALRGKHINFSWETHMGNVVGAHLYGIQLHSSNGAETARHTISRINGTSYQLNLDDIPQSVKGGNLEFRIFAHHPENYSASEPSGPYPESEWIPIQMIDYIQPSEAVDLGLSVKWSSSNLGAASATDVGDYYAWGETVSKSDFTWESYDHRNENGDMTKYNATDELTILLPEHDVVHKVKGGHWRMPTREEWDELYVCCDWQEVRAEDELLGYNIVSKKNGRMIYLPVTGYMDGTELKDGMKPRYWSSSLGNGNDCARNLYEYTYSVWVGNARYLGMPIRGVYEDSAVAITQSSIVDLGLSVKWAGYNLGAHAVDEIGDYYAWGELTPKPSYDWSNYVFMEDDDSNSIGKYNATDDLSILMREDDAAYQALGGPYWRMPSIEEWDELRNKCIWTEITINGRRGYLVKSPTNGNAIFLPFSGYMDGTELKDGMKPRYWSSSLGNGNDCARNLYEYTYSVWVGNARYLGMPVRAVYDESARKFATGGEFVDMGLSVDWASCNLGTSFKEEVGNYYAWGETVSKNEFVWENYEHRNENGDLTKYNTTDDISILLREHDAFYKQFGANYRIPTKEEWDELWNNCEREEKVINCRRGTLLTSKINGNKLFLPYSGYMNGTQLKDGMKPRYWSSSLGNGNDCARNLYEYTYSVWVGNARYLGMPIRGVRVKNEISVTSGEMVDLGLTVKWASCNVGATSPEDFGSYLAWGEHAPKPSYDWSNYAFMEDDGYSNAISKYSATDGRTILNWQDDVVFQQKGANWRMPTKADWEELQNNCDWTLTELNNIRGYVISSRQNGNSIFLPIGGYMDGEQLKDGMKPRYWSSSLGNGNDCARNLYEYTYSVWVGNARYLGMLVRGVYDNAVEVELTPGNFIDMGVSVQWSRCNIGSSKPEGIGSYYGWGEVNTHASYTWENYKYRDSASGDMEKYNSTDNLTILESSDDAAYRHSGGAQRMPTIEEWQELYANTTREEKICNGHAGLVLTSTVNGNKLFLPYSGYMDGTQLKDGMKPRYWSSSLGNGKDCARNLYEYTYSVWVGNARYLGLPIRGVKN